MNLRIMLTKLPLAALLGLASCGTIVNGTTQKVLVTSSPTHGAVVVDNHFVGYTPTEVILTRKDNHMIRIEIPGYRPYEMPLNRTMSGWVLGNLITGGVIGVVVDALSGGIYKLTPRQLHANMGCDQIASLEEGDVHIQVVRRANPEWEQIGQLDRIG